MNKEKLIKRYDEINDELKSIQKELDNEESNVDIEKIESRSNSLIEEKREIEKQLKELDKRVDERNKLIEEIANRNIGKTIIDLRKKEGENMSKFNSQDEVIRSKAYETAFVKTFIETKPNYTEEEQRALDTTKGAVLIPHQWMMEIIDEIKESHPILEDLTWNDINAIVEIPRRLSIISGDAKVVEEGTCAVGEENKFDSIQIDLVEIKKMLEITSKMGQLLPASFKTWLVNEVRDRIGHQLAVEVIEALKKDILEANKITGPADLETILKLFAAADGSGVPKVYANRKTLYGSIYSIKGAEGQFAFVANPVDALKGNLIGTETRTESGLKDNEILLLFPQDAFLNVPGGIRVKQVEDDCFNIKISGVVLAGARLKYRKGAAILTIQEAEA